MFAISLGVLIIGLIIGLVPLIVSIIRKRILWGVVAVVLCGVAACLNILVSIGVAVVALIVILVVKG